MLGPDLKDENYKKVHFYLKVLLNLWEKCIIAYVIRLVVVGVVVGPLEEDDKDQIHEDEDEEHQLGDEHQQDVGVVFLDDLNTPCKTQNIVRSRCGHVKF